MPESVDGVDGFFRVDQPAECETAAGCGGGSRVCGETPGSRCPRRATIVRTRDGRAGARRERTVVGSFEAENPLPRPSFGTQRAHDGATLPVTGRWRLARVGADRSRSCTCAPSRTSSGRCGPAAKRWLLLCGRSRPRTRSGPLPPRVTDPARRSMRQSPSTVSGEMWMGWPATARAICLIRTSIRWLYSRWLAGRSSKRSGQTSTAFSHSPRGNHATDRSSVREGRLRSRLPEIASTRARASGISSRRTRRSARRWRSSRSAQLRSGS